MSYTPLNKGGDTMSGTLSLPANGLKAGSNQLVLSGGNVGIGTTSPAASLDVAGAVKLGNTGTSVSAMGACVVSSIILSKAENSGVCAGLPTEAAVTCSGDAALGVGITLYCRVSSSGNVGCTISGNGNQTMNLYCMWMKP